MKFTRVLIILLVLVLLPFAIKVKGSGDFGQHQSLFTDIKAHQVGDILTVLIFEDARAQNDVTTKTEKSTEASASGGPGIGPLDFIPLFGAEAQNESKFDGKGSNQRNGTLRARMSVTVVDVKPNGDLVIEGSRTIGISQEKETISLTGVVRSRDVKPDNSIESYLIADASISYTGKGVTSSGTRPGIVTRVLNWLF